jgi:hypothetical protein
MSGNLMLISNTCFVSFILVFRISKVALTMAWTVWGSNPGGGREFLLLSRPALGLTQPPIQ